MEKQPIPNLILVCVADEHLARVVELALREMHNNAHIVREGMEAMDHTLDHRPDALVLGVTLPGLSGLDVARALRALELTRRIPILFVAQTDAEVSQVMQTNLSFVDWIRAPLNLSQFESQMGKLLQLNLHATTASTNGVTSISSIMDPLTGLYERHYLVHRLSYEAMRAARYRLGLACIALGIDGYEQAVQDHGRIVLDGYILEIAKIIQREARATDLVGHVSRDKFLVIVPHTDLNGARQLAERIQAETIKAMAKIPFTLSAGIAAVEGKNLTDNLTLLARAADALNRAQGEGKNQIIANWVV